MKKFFSQMYVIMFCKWMDKKLEYIVDLNIIQWQAIPESNSWICLLNKI